MVKQLLTIILILFCYLTVNAGSLQTVYLKIPAEQQIKYKSKLVSSKAFVIERDKKKQPTKVTLIADKPELLEDSKYIKEPKELKDKDDNVIGTTEETYPELVFQGKVLATLSDGSKIIHAIIPSNKYLKRAEPFIRCQDNTLEDYNPLKNLKLLGVEDQFIGYTRADVFLAYPELIGQRQVGVDEDGKPTLIDKLMKHRWSGEKPSL